MTLVYCRPPGQTVEWEAAGWKDKRLQQDPGWRITWTELLFCVLMGQMAEGRVKLLGNVWNLYGYGFNVWNLSAFLQSGHWTSLFAVCQDGCVESGLANIYFYTWCWAVTAHAVSWHALYLLNDCSSEVLHTAPFPAWRLFECHIQGLFFTVAEDRDPSAT